MMTKRTAIQIADDLSTTKIPLALKNISPAS
jgi:hypothetical protein